MFKNFFPVMLLVMATFCPKAKADGNDGAKDSLSNVTGFLLQVLFHESGHAAMASYYGWKIREFRPYPNICGGRLVGGCVIADPKPSERRPDGTMNRQYLGQSRVVSAAGSSMSTLGVLMFAPLTSKISSKSFWGQTLDSMLFYQNIDWLFYTVTDSISQFGGDWYHVSQTLNVPTYYFVPPAVLQYWLLKKYRGLFKKEKSGTSMVVFPEFYGQNDHQLTYGVRLLASF